VNIEKALAPSIEAIESVMKEGVADVP